MGGVTSPWNQPSRMTGVNRLEWMAVGWGGTVAGIGMVVISTGGGLVRLLVALCLCLLAGFLSGVRAEDRRVLHAVVTAAAGCVFWVLFVSVTRVVDLVGGPDSASWRLGGDSQVRNIALTVVAVVIGGILAAYRLRPQGGGKRRSRD